MVTSVTTYKKNQLPVGTAINIHYRIVLLKQQLSNSRIEGFLSADNFLNSTCSLRINLLGALQLTVI